MLWAVAAAAGFRNLATPAVAAAAEPEDLSCAKTSLYRPGPSRLRSVAAVRGLLRGRRAERMDRTRPSSGLPRSAAAAEGSSLADRQGWMGVPAAEREATAQQAARGFSPVRHLAASVMTAEWDRPEATRAEALAAAGPEMLGYPEEQATLRPVAAEKASTIPTYSERPSAWQAYSRVEAVERLERMDRTEVEVVSAEAEQAVGASVTDSVRRACRTRAAVAEAVTNGLPAQADLASSSLDTE